MTAHHAVLVVQVTDVERHNDEVPQLQPDVEYPETLQELIELLGDSDPEMVAETYWRATHFIGEVAGQYSAGKLGLPQKALAEQCYFAICRRLYNQLKARQRSHRAVLDELNDKLADKYICNFSVFQSLPDTWAIDQILPITPLHRHDEEPLRRAVLQDLTCDSDGKIKQYVDEQSIETSLPVHEVRPGEDYLLGVFLVGAYQEILGDMHNLFGDTDSVNIYQRADGSVYHAGIETHDTIEDMLRYVHLSPDELMTLLPRQGGQLQPQRRRAHPVPRRAAPGPDAFLVPDDVGRAPGGAGRPRTCRAVSPDRTGHAPAFSAPTSRRGGSATSPARPAPGRALP